MKGTSFHDHYHVLFDLRSSIDKETINYLEIGAYAGGSASLMASHPKHTNVYSVDLGQPIPRTMVEENIQIFKNPVSQFLYFEGSSHDDRIINQVHRAVKEVDILFIDGDHTFDGVIQDFNAFKDMVLPNGYIVFDDYMDWQHSPDVQVAVDHLEKNGMFAEYEIIGSLKYEALEHSNTQIESSNEFILRKKPSKEKPLSKIKTPVEKPIEILVPKGVFAVPPDESVTELEVITEKSIDFPLFLLNKKYASLVEKPYTTENYEKIRQLSRVLKILNAINS
jgi:hypothetical protein